MEVATPRYAGFWIRTAALLIDGILVNIGIFLLFLPIALVLGASGMGDLFDEEDQLWDLVNILIYLAYEAYMASSKYEGTFGKLIVNIKVVDEKMQRLSFMHACGRYLAKILSALILMIGFFMAGWTRKKQALHDMVASTYVVYRD